VLLVTKKAAEAWLRFGFWEIAVVVEVWKCMRTLALARRYRRMCVFVAGSLVGEVDGEAPGE